MVSQNVIRILDETKSLTLDELRQLRSLLENTSFASPALGKEKQLAHLLLERGIISHIRPTPTEADIASFNAWKPVLMQGKPLSETIVEERR